MAEHSEVILITGASRGIGRGIALELSRAGFSVAINYTKNLAAAEETLHACTEAARNVNQRFGIFQADVSDMGGHSRLIGEVLDFFGDLNGLINNAGVAPPSREDLLNVSEESYDYLMDVNLKGSFFLSQKVARYWLDQGTFRPGRRTMIFIGSVSADTVSLNRAEYCLAKSGFSMAARLFSVRLAGEGIPVYELRPGIIRTEMTAGVKSKYDVLIEEGLVPQKRWGTPEDMGKAAVALLGGAFGFSTGSIIHVDGGLHIPVL